MIVVKAGGAVGGNVFAICQDIATLRESGEIVVLVHGGSAEIDTLGKELGRSSHILTSVSGIHSRYTDPQTLDTLTLAMAGRIQPTIIQQLLSLNVLAVGLIGNNGGLIQAQRKAAIKVVIDKRVQIIRDDLTGRITHINTHLLHTLLGAGYVPVISPPAFDPEVGLVNVDADRVAAAVAVALSADQLIILSNVPGVLHDPHDATSLVTFVPPEDLEQCLGYAQGRMKLKVKAVQEALVGGVQRVVIGDSRCLSPIKQAISGRGTVFISGVLCQEEVPVHISQHTIASSPTG